MKLKPLYNFTLQNKSTYFSLLIYDIHKNIDSKCEKWFKGVFKEKIVPEDIYTNNLLMDLDYLFTEGLWVIEVANNLKLDVKDSSRRLIESYKKYTAKEDGYKDLISSNYYNKHKHRPYTKTEIKKRNVELNRIAKEVMAEILAEEKDKKSVTKAK